MVFAVGGRMIRDLQPQCTRMATGLAGGVGVTYQEMCGAISGGVLVIGALMGRTSLGESDAQALEVATRYRERFLAAFGDTQCAKLRDMVKAPGSLGSCAVLVERAAMILLQILHEAGYEPRA